MIANSRSLHPAAEVPLAVLDAGKLLELGQGDPKRIGKFVQLFIDQAAEYPAALEAALAAANLDTLGNLAHRYKSAARWLGGMALGAFLEALETAARAGETETAAALVSQCRAASADFLLKLEDHLASLKDGNPT